MHRDVGDRGGGVGAGEGEAGSLFELAGADKATGEHRRQAAGVADELGGGRERSVVVAAQRDGDGGCGRGGRVPLGCREETERLDDVGAGGQLGGAHGSRTGRGREQQADGVLDRVGEVEQRLAGERALGAAGERQHLLHALPEDGEQQRVAAFAELFAHTWDPVILFALLQGPRRRRELRLSIGGISDKALTESLRRLEDSGLVARAAFAEAPPRVDYGLTPLGESLRAGPVTARARWTVEHGDELTAAQERAERRRVGRRRTIETKVEMHF